MRKNNNTYVVKGVRFLSLFVFMIAAIAACLPVPLPLGKGELRGAILDPQGRVHMLYGNSEGLWYGITSGPSLIKSELVPTEWSYYRNALALDNAGDPHMISVDSEGHLIHVWKESGEWQTEIVDTSQSHLYYYAGSSIAIDDSGDMHISYPTYDFYPDIEIHYGVRHEGVWTLEPVEVVDGSYLHLALTQITLTPDQNPVIASAIGGFVEGCNSIMVHVAQRTMGGIWDTEEIFFQEAAYESYGMRLKDMSFIISASGKKAVGFSFTEGWRGGSGLDFYVMEDSGSGWEYRFWGGGWCSTAECTIDCQAHDIAYDPNETLYSLFTKEELTGTYPDWTILKTISMARFTDGGWEEKTIWNASLWGVMEGFPHLLLEDFPRVRIVYDDGHYSQNLFLMDFILLW